MAAAAELKAPPVRVPAKRSASMQLNNLSGDGARLAFVHRSVVQLVSDAHQALLAGRADVTRCAYKEADLVSQARFCQLAAGSVLVVCTTGGLLHVYDATGQKLLHFHQFKGGAALQGIASDGRSSIVVGSQRGDVHVFSVTQSKIVVARTLVEHKSPVTDVATTPVRARGGNKLLAVGDGDGAVSVWDMDNDFIKIARFEGGGFPCTSLAFAGAHLAAGFSTGHVRLFALATRSLFAEVAAHAREVAALAYSSAHNRLVSGSSDTVVNVWRMPTDANDEVGLVRSVVVPYCLITGAQFCGNGESLVAVVGYDSSSVRIVEL